MKNIDKHNNLSQSNVRDFLAKKVQEYGRMCSYNDIDDLEQRIKQLNVELENAKKWHAVMEIIKDNDWEQWDVSDDIEDYSSNDYFPFVGTKEEYEGIIR